MIWAGRVFAFIAATIGAYFLAAGGYLLALGGSPYYVAAGLLLGACAWLAWRRSPKAAWAYALLLALTVIWALVESGLDRWALSARLVAPAVLGLWLLVPAGGPHTVWIARLTAPAVLVFMGALLASPAPEAAPLPFPAAGPADPAASAADWAFYGSDAGGSRYSALDQITPANVAQLKPAWTHHMPMPIDKALSNLEVTPLKIGDSLYICNNTNVIQALDPVTDKPRWTFDPKIASKDLPPSRACRGVAYFKDAAAAGHCAERIIAASVDAGLWAIDAHDGKICEGFGQNGRADLAKGMGNIGDGYFYTTSAPVIIQGKAVVGGWVTDNQKTDGPPGVVRAYDVRTGAFAWAFDIGKPDVHTEPPPGQTYTLGTPNAWAPMAADEALGLIFVPIGNSGPDDFGGQRSAEIDKYSSSLVALDGQTGAPRWTFQTTHHDLWDYDVPSQPSLVDLRTDRGVTPAVLQATKAGRVYLLDRRNGQPLSRVVETPVPQTTVPGERTSKTQPIPVDMPQFDGPRLTEAKMWGATPIDQLLCRIRFKKAAYEGPYTPPRLGRETVSWPGFMGSISWGSLGVDRGRQVFVVNTSHVATVAELVPRAEADKLGVAARGDPEDRHVKGYYAMAGTPYALKMGAFLSPLGLPCNQPPYGLISAVDYKDGRLLWQRWFGTAKDSDLMGHTLGLDLAMGVPNIGGGIVTRSGLVFNAAAQEQVLRAIDIRTGKILWKGPIPAGGQATPMTYLGADGRQYVALTAGGKNLLKTKLGNGLIAFALPSAPGQ